MKCCPEFKLHCGENHPSDSYVHLERKLVSERGFGCLSCGTAQEIIFQCKNPKCQKQFARYYQDEPFDSLASHLCDECFMKEIKDSTISLSFKKIPTWRLNIDDASSEELMKKGGTSFGMPRMSSQKWTEFYEQEHEKKKVEQFNKQQSEEAKGTFSSITPQDDPTSTS